MCAVDAMLLLRLVPPVGLTPSSGMVSPGMEPSCPTSDYRLQGAMTFSMKDICSSTFVWKECKFLCIWKERGKKTWKFGQSPSLFVPSALLSFLFLSPSLALSPLLHPDWLSAMCFSLSVPVPITLNPLGRHIFHAPKPLKTKRNSIFFSQQCLFFPGSYWNVINSKMRKTYNSNLHTLSALQAHFENDCHKWRKWALSCFYRIIYCFLRTPGPLHCYDS